MPSSGNTTNDAFLSFQRGEEKAFAHFFKEFYHRLCIFANTIVKNSAAAEEIVGDVFIKVWEKRETLRNSLTLKNYYFISTRNACLRWIDSQQRKSEKEKIRLQGETSVTTSNVLDAIIYTEVIEEIHKALLKLPPQCRKVLTKLYVEGKSEAETARELHLSISTIKTHRKRGLKIIRGNISVSGSSGLLAWLLLLS